MEHDLYCSRKHYALKMTDTKGSTSNGADICALQKEWDEISCPICMEHPHNAVVLICASYEKGCRAYICDTSYRHSNCLDRFRKLRTNSNDPPNSNSTYHENVDAGTTLESPHIPTSRAPHPSSAAPGLEDPNMRRNFTESSENQNMEEGNTVIFEALFGDYVRSHSNQEQARQESQVEERGRRNESGGSAMDENCLKCPLCRGVVLSWMIVKEARCYMDEKIRNCSRESCSFSGNYKELRRHARGVHPMTRPAEVDPSRQRTWSRLQHQQEYGDILSAIRSTMPGAVFLGDYAIDDGDGMSGDGNEPWWTTTLFLLHMISSPLMSSDDRRSSSRSWRTRRRISRHRYLWGENLLGLQDDDGWSSDDTIRMQRRRSNARSRQDEGR